MIFLVTQTKLKKNLKYFVVMSLEEETSLLVCSNDLQGHFPRSVRSVEENCYIWALSTFA